MADLYSSSHLRSREATQQIWRKADAVCLDVDSTLVTIEGLDALAEYCGVGEEVKQWTKRAMGGSVTSRVPQGVVKYRESYRKAGTANFISRWYRTIKQQRVTSQVL